MECMYRGRTVGSYKRGSLINGGFDLIGSRHTLIQPAAPKAVNVIRK